MNRRTFSCLFTAVMFSMTAVGQISYSYDLAGNRVKREIVMSSLAPKNSLVTGFTEVLAKKNIRIYPNPTKGHLRVEVVGYDSTDKCLLQVFNATGALIINKKATLPFTEINITNQPNGIYLLQITLNGENTKWKIIKK